MNEKIVARELLRMAKELIAIEFPTQEAMDKYLKEHPGADRSNHKVVPHNSYKEFGQWDKTEKTRAHKGIRKNNTTKYDLQRHLTQHPEISPKTHKIEKFHDEGLGSDYELDEKSGYTLVNRRKDDEPISDSEKRIWKSLGR
jgi:hypothetical protein